MNARPLLLNLLAAALLPCAFAQTTEPEPAATNAEERASPPVETIAPEPAAIAVEERADRPVETIAPDPAPAPGGEETPEIVIGEEAGASVSRDQDTLSVDFPDEEIRTVLRNVADLFELNLVIPDTLQGSTSIKLRDVTWRQIFEVILSPIGFTFVEEGNIIKVVSQESLTLEPVTTDVFIVNYADASQLVASISPLIDPAAGGKIVVDKRSNALVITERPSRLTRVRPIIEQLDKATDQVMIESKFVEVTDRDLKNIGVNWASLSEYNISAGPVERTFSNQATRARNSERTRQDIDVPFMNNGYERADDLAARNSGEGPNTDPNTGIGPPFTIDQITGARVYDELGPSSLDETIFGGDLSRITTAVFNADRFNLILSALKSQNDTKLVSNPTVVTLNNTEAKILVGQQYPVARPQYNQETGQIYYDIATQDIGVQLSVTPHVNAQGFIRLKVIPEVSSLAGTATIPGGAEYPIIATRSATTEVSLKDGYTMGIGGLIESQSQNGQTKVPVLGSIPVLGRLFRSDSRSQDKRNLVIFITAKTVSADGAPVEEIFDSRAIREMNLRREDLPGYRDGTDPFEALPPADPSGS